MPLNESQINAIQASIIEFQTVGESLIPGLRGKFPEIVFVRCDASDMDGKPYRSSNSYQLYLLDRSEVCIRLTEQLESADGVIVAEVE